MPKVTSKKWKLTRRGKLKKMWAARRKNLEEVLVPQASDASDLGDGSTDIRLPSSSGFPSVCISEILCNKEEIVASKRKLFEKNF